MTEFCVPMRVYIEDTDAGGIVYYANYLKFMERARTELMRSLGYGKPALFDGLQLVVHEVQVKYHSPAVLDDEIRVLVALESVRKVTLSMSQNIVRGDTLLCEGHVKLACLNVATKKPVAMPQVMYQKLIGLMAQDRS
jgi:4-hydroxybenzoyl-CoA thioesterase/acyl-CoA thioester hydrolase